MKKLTKEDFDKRLKQIDLISDDEYINNVTPMKFKHLVCGNDFIARPMEIFNLKNGKCPKCQKYKHYSFDDFAALLKNSYPEYSLISKNGSKIILKHTCGNEFETTVGLFFKAKVPCPKCSHRNLKKTDEEFKQEVFNKVGNEYTFLEPYKNNMTKLLVRHNTCGHEYSVSPNKFLQLGRRCPYCAGNMKKTLDEVKNEFYKLDPSYEILSLEYIPSKPLKVLHKTCGHEFTIRRHDFIKKNGNRCPYCSKRRSIHEEIIEKYLKDHKIKYIHQYKISNHRSFDFYIDNKIMLEYDGEYHYHPIAGNTKKFENQRKSDIAKEEYCTNMNILLIRIPYWYEKNLEYILDKISTNDLPKSSIGIQDSINNKIEYFEKI